MARRLTTFSKLLIVAVILGALYYAFTLFQKTDTYRDLIDSNQTENTSDADDVSAKSDTKSDGLFGKKTSTKDRDKTLKVQLVTWGGYAPGLYFNEGASPNERSRFFKNYGFYVDFTVENDLINAMNSWISGEYDIIVQTADAFPLYTAPQDINQYKPKAFMQVDWSRGGDAIIVKRGINTINDLKGKTVAVAVPSPAQTLLISSLEAAGLSYADVKVIKTPDNIKAAELFRSSAEVDAAVVWSPDDILATQDVQGSKILLTTNEQTHIIADIMLAKEDVIREKQAMFDGFYEGWMIGVAELKTKANLPKAAKYLAELNQLSVDDAMGMMETVQWTTHGDNLNFFGFNKDYKGQKGQDLYSKMSRKFIETGDAENVAPNWRSVVNTNAIRNASITGALHDPEGGKEFAPVSTAEKSLPAFAAKPLSINFSTGQHQLTENAKTIIDLQFADVAKSFAGVKVRVEGNTDTVGSRANNLSLSQKRAKAVADYLIEAYSMNPNRFVIVGNGPDKPIAGCERNDTPDCRAKNRRTEFQLISGN